VACRPRLGREDGPQVPLARVELGGSWRRDRIRRCDDVVRDLLRRVLSHFPTLRSCDRIGLHGSDVGCGRQLGGGGFRQPRHRGDPDTVERVLDRAAQLRDACPEVGGNTLGREDDDVAAAGFR